MLYEKRIWGIPHCLPIEFTMRTVKGNDCYEGQEYSDTHITPHFTPTPTTLAPILPITSTHHFTIPTPTILSNSPNSTINKIHPFYGLQKEKAGFGSMIVVLNRDEIDTNLLIVSLVEQLYCD